MKNEEGTLFQQMLRDRLRGPGPVSPELPSAPMPPELAPPQPGTQEPPTQASNEVPGEQTNPLSGQQSPSAKSWEGARLLRKKKEQSLGLSKKMGLPVTQGDIKWQAARNDTAQDARNHLEGIRQRQIEAEQGPKPLVEDTDTIFRQGLNIAAAFVEGGARYVWLNLRNMPAANRQRWALSRLDPDYMSRLDEPSERYILAEAEAARAEDSAYGQKGLRREVDDISEYVARQRQAENLTNRDLMEIAQNANDIMKAREETLEKIGIFGMTNRDQQERVAEQMRLQAARNGDIARAEKANRAFKEAWKTGNKTGMARAAGQIGIEMARAFPRIASMAIENPQIAFEHAAESGAIMLAAILGGPVGYTALGGMSAGYMSDTYKGHVDRHIAENNGQLPSPEENNLYVGLSLGAGLAEVGGSLIVGGATKLGKGAVDAGKKGVQKIKGRGDGKADTPETPKGDTRRAEGDAKHTEGDAPDLKETPPKSNFVTLKLKPVAEGVKEATRKISVKAGKGLRKISVKAGEALEETGPGRAISEATRRAIHMPMATAIGGLGEGLTEGVQSMLEEADFDLANTQYGVLAGAGPGGVFGAGGRAFRRSARSVKLEAERIAQELEEKLKKEYEDKSLAFIMPKDIDEAVFGEIVEMNPELALRTLYIRMEERGWTNEQMPILRDMAKKVLDTMPPDHKLRKDAQVIVDRMSLPVPSTEQAKDVILGALGKRDDPILSSREVRSLAEIALSNPDGFVKLNAEQRQRLLERMKPKQARFFEDMWRMFDSLSVEGGASAYFDDVGAELLHAFVEVMTNPGGSISISQVKMEEIRSILRNAEENMAPDDPRRKRIEEARVTAANVHALIEDLKKGGEEVFHDDDAPETESSIGRRWRIQAMQSTRGEPWVRIARTGGWEGWEEAEEAKVKALVEKHGGIVEDGGNHGIVTFENEAQRIAFFKDMRSSANVAIQNERGQRRRTARSQQSQQEEETPRGNIPTAADRQEAETDDATIAPGPDTVQTTVEVIPEPPAQQTTEESRSRENALFLARHELREKEKLVGMEIELIQDDYPEGSEEKTSLENIRRSLDDPGSFLDDIEQDIEVVFGEGLASALNEWREAVRKLEGLKQEESQDNSPKRDPREFRVEVEKLNASEEIERMKEDPYTDPSELDKIQRRIAGGAGADEGGGIIYEYTFTSGDGQESTASLANTKEGAISIGYDEGESGEDGIAPPGGYYAWDLHESIDKAIENAMQTAEKQFEETRNHPDFVPDLRSDAEIDIDPDDDGDILFEPLN